MIQIGLTGWGDHPDIYNPYSSTKRKVDRIIVHIFR